MKGAHSVSRTRYVATLILALIIVVAFGYLFGIRNMRFFLVPSASMEPTLLPRDYIVTLNGNPYRRGDIVVLKDPEDAKSYVVKRIVGVPGDSIAIGGGALFVNDKYASEPYIKEPMEADVDKPIQVPEGQLLVLGDNRNESKDSLSWGHCIPLADVIGKVRYIYSPTTRMGLVASYPLANTDGL